MFRIEYNEDNKIDVDGIPVANESNLRIRLRKVNSKVIEDEFSIVKDQIVNTLQYLKFVNAIMTEKEKELRRKELLKNNTPESLSKVKENA